MRRFFSNRLVLTVVLCGLVAQSGPTLAQEPVYQPINDDGLQLVEPGGFGDPANAWAASMQWFQGRLFVGTLRWGSCALAAALSARLNLPLYPPPSSACPPEPTDLELAAEIWRLDPSSGAWTQVYVSPVDVPVAFDRRTGLPTKFTARDIAYPAMAIHRESDGTEALYVGATSPAGIFGRLGLAAPPRLLRSVDGSTFDPVPADPGTFMGDLGGPLPGSASAPIGFSELVSSGGHLLGLLRTTRGVGTLIASSESERGNDAWGVAGPLPEELPMSALASFNGSVYVGALAPGRTGGYSIHKSSLSGTPPFSFTPVLEQPDALRTQRIANFAVNANRLYAGTSWPTELLRIAEDDSWQVIVGDSRDSGSGPLRPLSGIVSGFGNDLNVQFSSMASHDDELYVGTLDASTLARLFPSLSPLLGHEFGFDLLRSREGVYWYPVTRAALGNNLHYGVQSLASTPNGLYAGTATGTLGAQVWHQPAGTPTVASFEGPAPFRMEAASTELTSGDVILSWEPLSDAVVYHVYRSTVLPVLGGLASLADALETVEIPVGAGTSAFFCDLSPELCVSLQFLGTDFGIPGPFLWTSATTDLFYVESQPTSLQAVYFVRAELADGSLTVPSNIAGGASTAAPITFPLVDDEILTMFEEDELGIGALRSLTMVRRAEYAISGGNVPAAKRLLDIAEGIVVAQRGIAIAAEYADDLSLMIYRLKRNVQLVEWGLVPLEPIM